MSNRYIFFNELLANNALLVKSLCFLWHFKASDIIFIAYQQTTQIQLKGKFGWKKDIRETFNIPFENL